jgi:hypothetical protein
MTRTIYAHLQLWDPMGQVKIDPGLTYGGQTMLFVLAADDLVTGLETLIEATRAKGLGLIRLIYAGYTEDFEPDHFPFEADLAPMIEDAVTLGKICALGPFTFPPNQLVVPLDVTVAIVELAAEGGAEGGALILAAVEGSVAVALPRLLVHLRREGQRLRSLEDVKDATEHSEDYGFKTSIEDMVAEARGADAPVFSDSITFGDNG